MQPVCFIHREQPSTNRNHWEGRMSLMPQCHLSIPHQWQPWLSSLIHHKRRLSMMRSNRKPSSYHRRDRKILTQATISTAGKETVECTKSKETQCVCALRCASSSSFRHWVSAVKNARLCQEMHQMRGRWFCCGRSNREAEKKQPRRRTEEKRPEVQKAIRNREEVVHQSWRWALHLQDCKKLTFPPAQKAYTSVDEG